MDNAKKDVVFIIDDNSSNIKILGNLLEEKGYEPVVFLNAKTALDSIKDKKPEIILLDIMMPEMDGYEMCKILKDDTSLKDIPVIFLTGKTETDDLVKGFELGAADYVKKPFEFAELLARIKTHIGFKKAREEIKILSGLLPICSNCKKIRDDKGYWNQIDVYIQKHSEAKFTHSMCSECSDEVYGKEDWYIEMKKEKSQKE